MNETWVVILAAGAGTRMRSDLAKVLHPLGGRPLIAYPVKLAQEIGARGTVVVVGRDGDRVRAALRTGPHVDIVEQAEPRGTGHAMTVAKPAVPAEAREVVVLYGDVPLLSSAMTARMLARHRQARAAATVLTFVPDDPTGYGRIVRRGGARGPMVAIVEERDATPRQRRLGEANSGIYCFDPRPLWPALDCLSPQNDQGELYLTDVIRLFSRTGFRVEAVRTDDAIEVLGVNDRRQLATLAAVQRQRILAGLMSEGVTILDPSSTYVGVEVRIGRDTVLYPGVLLEGRTTIGAGCVVGTGCQLADATLGDRVRLRPYCVLADATVEAGASLGPFAHLRPESVVGPDARIGNFVEIKKSTIARGAKVPHLSYVGDATIGPDANLGAGTITCNYDGVRKHETHVGARAFVGTNSSLVAPLTIGEDAYVGAGSVITKDVPAGALAVGRAHQVVKEGWAASRRARQEARGTPPPPD